MAHTDLVLQVASDSITRNHLMECLVDTHMRMMHSLLNSTKSQSVSEKMQLHLILIQSYSKFLCIETHQESIQSKIWDCIPQHRKTTLVHRLWELCLLNSESTLVIQGIIRIFSCLVVFQEITSMPDTCINILTFILNSFKTKDSILLRNAFMPFVYRFVLTMYYKEGLEMTREDVFVDSKSFDVNIASEMLWNSMDIYLNHQDRIMNTTIYS